MRRSGNVPVIGISYPRKGIVSLIAVAALLLAFVGLGLCGRPSSSAYAYTVGPPSEGTICAVAGIAAVAALEAHLSPASGTSVQAGSSVTFSGEASAPVTVSIASSSELLSNPDIDTGLATPGTQPDSYTFTSTKAAATPRTVYWQASFSDATLSGCEGVSSGTLTTQPRTLTVVPAPAPAPAPSPQPTPPAPTAPVASQPPIQVRISATDGFNHAHPTFSYRVHCSASCKGQTSAEVLVLHRHATPKRFAKLEFGPSTISIAGPNGGYEQFSHHYGGATLRMLERLFRPGNTVELRIHVSGIGAAGELQQSQSTIIPLRYKA
jgi:hypothetical protein